MYIRHWIGKYDDNMHRAIDKWMGGNIRESMDG